MWDAAYRYPDGYQARSAAELDLGLLRVPAYAAWHACDPGAAATLDARYAALPLLTKADIRRWDLAGFTAPGYDADDGLARHAVDLVHTSGSTDERVRLLWHQAWWDASEHASWQLNRHAIEANLDAHPEAILTSPRSTGVATRDGRPLPMAVRRLARFLYLNEHRDARCWDDDHIRRMCDELGSFRPVVLEANPTLLARFARRMGELGLRCWQPRLIVLTYEWPSRLQRRAIRQAFAVPQMSSHGSTEAGCIFTECEAGCFHQNTAFVRVELQPVAAPWHQPGLGRLAVTTFGNPWRVLLRFDVGDLARLRPPDQPCHCGRTEGVVADALEGRIKDLTFDAAGAPVTVDRLDAALSMVPGLREYQVVQTAPAVWRARVVVDDEAARRAARAALLDLYRGRDLRVTRVPVVAPERSGKHRLAYCRMPFDANRLFAGPSRAPGT
jgi:phenylacetate-coenzyme A ligase PaaK-like adenylate-forming protein